MVHNVVDLLWFEFVLYRHDDCTIGDNSQESYCPLATISTADGNLVALLKLGIEFIAQFTKFCAKVQKILHIAK